MPRYGGERCVVHPCALPAQQAHIREQLSRALHLGQQSRWKHMLITDHILWQAWLEAGIVTEQRWERRDTSYLASGRLLCSTASESSPGDWLTGYNALNGVVEQPKGGLVHSQP